MKANYCNTHTLSKWLKDGVIGVNDVVELQQELSKIRRVHDFMIEIGMPKKLVDFYAHPYVTSGYSMGETIEILYLGNSISVIDNREKYRGKYRGRETYGKVVINFSTKKDLREYLQLCYDIEHANYRTEEMFALCDRKSKLISKCIVDIKSRLKNVR